MAAIQGRNFVLPDDVKRMVQPVLAHRLILRPGDPRVDPGGGCQAAADPPR